MSGQSVSPGDAEGGLLWRGLRRLIDVQPHEMKILAWSWLYFFSVLCAYYVIRPLRDEIGAASGAAQLPYMFAGTLLGMMAANPPFSALVARLSPLRFISITYRFFESNLLVFLILLETFGNQNAWVGRILFVWTAIFSLFVVSVFWGFMVDVFDNDQSRRLFGFIAAGGTLGGIAGSAFTALLVARTGRSFLLLVSAALLETAVFSVRRVARSCRGMRERRAARAPETTIGGGVASGFAHALKSPYLLNISAYMLLFAVLSTFLYFQQAEIARTSFTDRAARTAFFADIDLTVNILTLAIQLLLTGRIVKMLGVALTLTLLPALHVLGFLLVSLAPTLWSIVVFQVLRRAGEYAVARPAREILFTVVPREDKYKAKSFIDTFVYRAGDQVGAWSYTLMGFLGLAVAGVGVAAVPISLAWLGNGLWLGRRQERLRAQGAKA